jgi:hypothetical protein
MPTHTRKKEAQQALHWAPLASKNNPDTITILVTPDRNWYHNLNPHEGPFPDSHVIAHFKADTITYEEPTIPSELRIEPIIENRAIHILCVQHKGTPTGSKEYTQQMYNIANTLDSKYPQYLPNPHHLHHKALQ